MLVSLVLGLSCLLLWGTSPALAVLTDDHYDGNIFPLYAGNGSIVPPRFTLAQSLRRDKATMLVFYIDDSSDSKEFASVVSLVDSFYGRAVDILALSVDTLPVKATYEPTEPGYYYAGKVPQTVIFDPAGNVMLNETGNIAFEQIDDQFRAIFDLLPRTESVELKRRQVNEITTELAP